MSTQKNDIHNTTEGASRSKIETHKNENRNTNKEDGSMVNHNALLEKNSEELWNLTAKLSKYNSKGQCTISKDEVDFNHNEWDKLYPKKK